MNIPRKRKPQQRCLFTGLYDNSGWKGSSGGFWSNLLLRAWSAVRSNQLAYGYTHMGLQNLKGEGIGGTVPLDSLFHCSAVLKLKNLSLNPV